MGPYTEFAITSLLKFYLFIYLFVTKNSVRGHILLLAVNRWFDILVGLL